MTESELAEARLRAAKLTRLRPEFAPIFDVLDREFAKSQQDVIARAHSALEE